MSLPPLELKNEIVRAGAGAGKTTHLVQRVVDVVNLYREREGRFPRLVVTTFTRKATQELRDRLLVRACELQDPELLDYFASRSRLHISTIHGVMTLFCRRYGHLWGLDTNFTIMGQQESELLQRKILRQLLLSDPSGQALLEDYSFNDLTKLCVAFHEALAQAPGLRMATAAEMADLARAQFVAAADELLAVGQQVLAESQDEKFKSYAQQMLRVSEALRLPLNESNYETMTATAEALTPKARYNPKKPQISLSLKETMHEAVERVIKLLQDEALHPSSWVEFERLAGQFEALAAPFARELDAAKLAGGKLAMNDLELLSLKAIRQQEGLAEAFAADFDYWLIDEFQDTSPLQVELLGRLIGNRMSYSVGDPQQSIYLFRGARVEVFNQRERALAESGGQLTRLDKNYRSQPPLLLFLNDFFTAMGRDFSPMQPRGDAVPSPFPVATFYHASESDDGRPRGDEYRGLLGHIEVLLQREGTKLSDICILARTNRTLAELAQFLKNSGYPTHVHAAKGYFERREVRDALALLKFLVNPHDNFSLTLLLRSPWCRIPDQTLAQWTSASERSYWEYISATPAAKSHSVIAELQKLRELSMTSGLSYALERGLIDLGVFDFCSHHDATGRRESNLWKLVHSLRETERQPGFRVLEFVAQSFVDITDATGSEEGDAITAIEPDCINLMTVHAAKGLQRRHVILPHCDQAPQISNPRGFTFCEDDATWSISVPLGEDNKMKASLHAKNWNERVRTRELAELDRLLYVALTRAQESVYISWTGEPDRHSWGERWRWPLKEPGLCQHGPYTVEYRRGPSEHGGRVSAVRGERRVRAPFSTAPIPALEGTYSVTDLIAESVSPSKPSARVISGVAERVSKASDGVLVHRLMEGLRYKHEMNFTTVAENWFGARAQAMLSAIEFVRTVQKPPMKPLLETGEVEWGFQLLTSAGILEGQIDLWGVDRATGEVWVVDYKSGSPDYVDKAMTQLAVYALALERFGAGHRINMAAIYPLHKLVEIRPYPGSGAVVARFPQLSQLI